MPNEPEGFEAKARAEVMQEGVAATGCFCDGTQIGTRASIGTAAARK